LLFICCVPFLKVYLPKAAETGMHQFSDILAYSLKPTDVVNVGPHLPGLSPVRPPSGRYHASSWSCWSQPVCLPAPALTDLAPTGTASGLRRPRRPATDGTIERRPVFQINREAELTFFAAMNQVPPQCRVFFAENSRPGPDYQTLYRHNVDAMLLAKIPGTPTINGFATFLPPYWNLFHPESPDYLPAVRTWLINHAVAGPVCGINFKTGAWSV
jgi:hypothetical protein